MNVIPSSSTTLPKDQPKKPGRFQVSFYDEPPNCELSLDEFEIYALKRLKALRKIEQLNMTRGTGAANVDKTSKVMEYVQKELSDPDEDKASHFILRLSYCQNEELRRWFLQQESTLFKLRLQKQFREHPGSGSVQQYAKLATVDEAEMKSVREMLRKLDSSGSTLAKEIFYKVPFTQVPDLVATRQVYLKGGFAYVAESQVFSILTNKFRTELSRKLSLMASAGSFLSSNDPEAARIHPLLKNLHSCVATSEPASHEFETDSSTKLSAHTVAKFAVNMPLCMRQCQSGLERDKKLKHGGRMQYGLFLKGAGLSMDDALAFFQRHFTTVTGEQFQKQYAYSIRHMHGKEGKRVSYTPYTCSKIILGSAPSSGDHHGCPYKHYDNDHLLQLLQKLHIGTPSERAEIMSLKKSNQFQLACQKHFEVMHPNANEKANVTLDNVGNHPNAWFRASVAYHDNVSSQQ